MQLEHQCADIFIRTVVLLDEPLHVDGIIAHAGAAIFQEIIKRLVHQRDRLRFIEHVRAQGFGGRVQDVIKPVWGYFGAGCNPNRRTADALRDAGFDVTIKERRKIMGSVPLIVGSAKAR